MDAYDQIAGCFPGSGHGRRARAPHATIQVRGPDAVDFLHRLCSQDLHGLPAGRAAPAAFLTAKGRLAAVAVIGRLADDRLVVETRATAVGPLAELLDRYHFAERLSIELPTEGQACTELVGVDLPDGSGPSAWSVEAAEDGTIALTGRRRGRGFVRCHGPIDRVEAFAADAPPIDDELAECLRIVTGHVVVGEDTDESTLALEPDLDDHVSTTKGCYTGQEIVARIHTYGHVNRRILPISVATSAAIRPDTTLVDSDGDAVGRVRSSRRIPGTGQTVAMAVLPTAFLDAGGAIRLGAVDGPVAELVALRDD
jgi:folate-binding protein YgfZ